MRYLLFTKLLAVSLFLLGCSSAFSSEEKVKSFHSEITIDSNNDVHVLDRLEVVALGQNVKRGIFYTVYASKWILSDESQIGALVDTLSNGSVPEDFDITDPPLGKAVKGFDNKFTINAVTKNGQPEPYRIELVNNGSVFGFIVGKRIRIGEETVFLTPGTYTYETSYRFRDNIVESGGRKYAKIKLSGFGWDLPLEKISGRIQLPSGAKVISAFCHTSKKLDSDCDITWSDETIEVRDIGNGKQRGLSATIVWTEPAAIS